MRMNEDKVSKACDLTLLSQGGNGPMAHPVVLTKGGSASKTASLSHLLSSKDLSFPVNCTFSCATILPKDPYQSST